MLALTAIQKIRIYLKDVSYILGETPLQTEMGEIVTTCFEIGLSKKTSLTLNFFLSVTAGTVIGDIRDNSSFDNSGLKAKKSCRSSDETRKQQLRYEVLGG